MGRYLQLADQAVLAHGNVAKEEGQYDQNDKNDQSPGMPRKWTEGVARLCAMPAPADVPERRWLRLFDDCSRFADRWAATAAALGWGPLDLWGCDPARPFARLDKQGLLWLLDGRELVALTADNATIRTASGATLIYRRRASGPELVVLAWELGP